MCDEILKEVVVIKRFVIEFGFGTDFHGQSVTKAATKAVKDAVSKSCLSGLEEVMGYSLEEMNEKVLLKITIAVSRPDEVDKNAIKAYLPIGQTQIEIVSGGLRVKGINISEFGDTDDSIESQVVILQSRLKKLSPH